MGVSKNAVTTNEIDDYIKSLGGHKVTKEEKKTDLYKLAIKKPSCFRSKK